MAVLTMGSLPLGFRFKPTDEEVINHYLRLKINGRDSEVQVIPEIDICKWEPWDLPGLSVIKTDDPEWFFFCPRDRKYPNGHRSNRATDAGYWKATGKDRNIKCRKSGSNGTLIGMKKTLVFYRGRAPKGERTHWIMHEYRATQKHLDGTQPGQSPFVLFRLFRKQEEKAEVPDVSKYDEVEHTGCSPTATRSSPDDTSSDLVQDTPMSGIQVVDQCEGIKRWLIDESDKMTPNALLPVDTSSISYNSCMASDVEEDHVAEGTGIEVLQQQPGDNSKLNELAWGQIDWNDFPMLQSQIPTELPPYNVDSPFASDFGNDSNALNFQDGTAELDISLKDLLDEVYNNNDEFSCDGSTSQKNSVVGSDTQFSGQLCKIEIVPPGDSYDKDIGACSDTDTEMAQVQHDSEMGASGRFNEHVDKRELLQMQPLFGSSQAHIPLVDEEPNMKIEGVVWDNPVQYASSPYSAMSSTCVLNLEEPTDKTYQVNNGSIPVGGTGIKIRTRQPQPQQISNNFGSQGTAPRRIRLQMKVSLGPACSSEVTSASSRKEEEDEVQSTVTEAKEPSDHSPTFVDPEEGSKLLKTQCTTPRIVPLQMKSSHGSVSHSEVRGGSHSEEEDEVQSTVTETKEASEHNPIFVEPKEGSKLKFEESRGCTGKSPTKLRLRAKHDVLQGSSHMEKSEYANAPPTQHAPRFSLVHRVGVSLVAVLFGVVIGVWRCFRS